MSAPELDDDETSINRQVVRLMGLTEDTEDNHWLSIHALRMRYSDASIIQPMAMRLWAKGETSHMYKMYAPRGLTDTDSAVVVFHHPLQHENHGVVSMATTAPACALVTANKVERALAFTRYKGWLLLEKMRETGFLLTTDGHQVRTSKRQRVLSETRATPPFYYHAHLSAHMKTQLQPVRDELDDGQFASGVHLNLPAASEMVRRFATHFELLALPLWTVEQRCKALKIISGGSMNFGSKVHYLILNFFDFYHPSPVHTHVDEGRTLYSRFPHANWVAHIPLWGELKLEAPGLGPLPTVDMGTFLILPARLHVGLRDFRNLDPLPITLTVVY